ncbi:MAG: 4Fe-4S binding protein [candidate division WOR-3 bacterium]
MRKKFKLSSRRIIQIVSFIIFNPYILLNPKTGKVLYQGKLKSLCVPILNCYSCPLAVGSCPLGALQQTIKISQIPYLLLGFFGTIGIFIGRYPCGNFCPFGFLQELLYRIKSFKFRVKRPFRYIKYIFLILSFLIPFLYKEPFFCKFICPAGTIEASLPQIIFNPALLSNISWIFYLKIFFGISFIFSSITTKRFFCSTVCPIGAIYGLLNRISLLQIKYDKEKCTKCGVCNAVCPMDINIYENPHDIDCIRCFECVNRCPYGALKVSNNFKK